MSLIDLASLVLAPTAVKDGKVYNAIPNDQDFTFSRGTEATRVNSAGLIEKARTNYLYYSQDFSNSNWVLQNNATITHNITDPNGGTTASRLTFDALTNSGLYQQQLTNFGTGLIRTASIYLKGAVGGENVMIGDASNRTRVVLTTDWVRYEGFASDDSTFFIIYTDHISGASSDTIDIAFAQYENGLVAQSYIETTTSAVYEGITDDVPRVDYSGKGCPSLLLEGQRTNAFNHSEYFDSSYYTKSFSTITTNSTISPDGKQNAAELVEDTSNNRHLFFNTSAISGSSSPYTVSIFLKQNTRRYAFLQIATDNASKRQTIVIDLSDGSITDTANTGSPIGVSYNVESFLNGFYRASLTATNTSGGVYIVCGLSNSATPTYNSSKEPIYTGNGSSIYCYGAMLEAGSYSTSYLPSYGTSTSRSADSCSLTNASNLIGQSEGTLFFQLKDTNNLTAYLGVDNGSTGTRILIYGINDQKIYTQVRNSGTLIFSASSSVISGGVKVAVSFDSSGSVFYVNGLQVSTGSGTTYTNLSQVTFNHSSQIGVKMKQAILFPTRLTNDQLAELTK